MSDPPQRKDGFVTRSKDWIRRKKDRFKDRFHIGSSSAPTTRAQSPLVVEGSTSNAPGSNQQDTLTVPAPLRAQDSQSSPELVTEDTAAEVSANETFARDGGAILEAPAAHIGAELSRPATPIDSGASQGQEPRVEPLVQPDTGVEVSPPAQEAPTQEKTPVPPPAQKSASKPSAAKNVLNRSWDFTQTLLKRLPDVVDENPVKVVLGLVKLVAEIKEEVQDNMDKTDEHIASTVAQLAILGDAKISQWGVGGPEAARLEDFKGTLGKELENLGKLKAEHILERVASHEDEKTEIAAIFERVNQARIHFELYTNVRVLKAAVRLEQDAMRSLPDKLQPSHMADHRYYLGGKASETLQRDPCTPGTRTRILGNIVDWANSTLLESEDIYWLFGPAGSGKTTIAYTIARFLEAAPTTGGTIALGGNFLCSRQFEETRSVTRIIRTLAYQLARKCEGFADALNELKNFDAIHQDVGAQIHDFLITPWRKFISIRRQQGLINMDHFLFLVDAVDELEKEGGEEFLKNLIESVNSATGDLQGIKFFVTSRSNPDIVTLVESLERRKIVRLQDVEQEEIQTDITTYLETSLPQFKGLGELDLMKDFAGGLFICAATIVRQLTLKQNTVPEQKVLLKKLLSPRTAAQEATPLDNLYFQILSEAFDQFSVEFLEDKLSILHTFLCTVERTSTGVVGTLLSQANDPDDLHSPLSITDSANKLLSSLHAVLYLDDHQNVLSYHKSFADFVFDKHRSGKFACDQLSHHYALSQHCLHTMDNGLKFNIAKIPSSFYLDTEIVDLPTKVTTFISPGLGYACQSWNQHLASAAPCNPSSTILSTLSNFLQLQVLFWIEAMTLLKQRGQCHFAIRQAATWVGSNDPTLHQQLSEAEAFSLYFSGSPASLSTPHLYISALATWPPDQSLSSKWRAHFPRIPNFRTFSSGRSMELMNIKTEGVGWAAAALAVSPDGTKILCGSQSGVVHVYDASTGEELAVFKGHTQEINSITISDDGAHIISGSDDNTIRIWDASSRSEVMALNGHTGSIYSVVAFPDGNHIASGSEDKSVKIWDKATGQCIQTFTEHTSTVISIAVSSDGKYIISGSDDHNIHIWSGLEGAKLAILKGHDDFVRCVAISKNGAVVVSGSDDNSVRIWSTSTYQELKKLEGHTNLVLSVAISPDGSYIASGSSDKSVRIWDTSTGQQLKVLDGHSAPVRAVAIFANGTRIASSSSDGSVKVWDGSVVKEMLGGVGAQSSSAEINPVTGSGFANAEQSEVGRQKVEGHKGAVMSVAISSDGRRIISGSQDKTIRVWDVATGKEVMVLEGHSGTVNSVSISPNGAFIVSGSDDNSVRIWNSSTEGELRVLHGHDKEVRAVTISRDGTQIFSGSRDCTVRVWSTGMGEEQKVLRGHTGSVYAIAISKDGKHVASGSCDNSVRLWNGATGEALKTFKGHTDFIRGVAVSEGTIISGSDDRTVRIWDTSTGECPKVLEGHTDRVNAVAISADGTCIISGSRDNSVRIWEVSTGKVLGVLEGHKGGVTSVALSADGKYVVSGSRDGTVRMWDIDPSRFFISGDSNPSHADMHVTQDMGWVMPLDKSKHLVFIPPSMGFQIFNSLYIFPKPPTTTAIPPSLKLDYSALGENWHNCYNPHSLSP